MISLDVSYNSLTDQFALLTDVSCKKTLTSVVLSDNILHNCKLVCAPSKNSFIEQGFASMEGVRFLI